MANSSIGPRIVVSGEQAFNAAILSINANMRKMASELKTVQSSFNKTDDALTKSTKEQQLFGGMIDQTKGKIETLNKQIDIEKDKLGKLEKELIETRKKHGEMSEEAGKAENAFHLQERRVANLSTQLSRTENDLNKYSFKLEESGKEANATASKTELFKESLSFTEKQLKKCDFELKGAREGVELFGKNSETASALSEALGNKIGVTKEKIGLLTSELYEEKEALSRLKGQLEDVIKKHGENSKEAIKAQSAIQKKSAVVSDYELEIQKAEGSVANLTREYVENAKAVDITASKTALLDQTLETTETTINSYDQELQHAREELEKVGKNSETTARLKSALGDQIGATEKKMSLLNDKIKEEATSLNKLESQLENVKKEHGENSEKAMEAERAFEEQKKVVIEYETELRKTKQALSDTSKELENLEDKLKQSGEALSVAGDKATEIGKGFMPASAAVTAIGVAAAKTGMDFDTQMSRVKAIAGATETEFDSLREQAIKLGADTTFSARESADGMEEFASAGFEVNEIMSAMPGILDLAAVSGGDIGLASEVASTSIRAFGLEAEQVGHVADVFARAAADTNAEVLDMGEAMKYVAPVAKATGISIEETAAAIGIMSDSGIKGSQAGTALRGALSRLSKPTDAMEQAMDRLGISFYDSNGNMKSLEEQMGMLQTAFVGLTEEEKNHELVTLFGQEALSGMLALVEGGPDQLNGLTESLENSDGAAQEMADTINDNTAGAIEEMGGALESAAIAISDVVAPAIRKAAKFIENLTNKFNDLSPGAQKVIVVLGGIVAAIGPALLIIGKLLSSFGGIVTALPKISSAFSTAFTAIKGAFTTMGTAIMAHPVVAAIATAAVVIGSIIAYLVHLYKTNDEFREKVNNAWDSIKNGVINAWNKIKDTFTSIIEWVKDNWQGLLLLIVAPLAGAFKLLYDNSDKFKEWIDGIVKSVKEFFTVTIPNAWKDFVAWIKGIPARVSGWFSDLWANIKSFFKDAWEWITDIPNKIMFMLGRIAREIWDFATITIPNAINNIVEWFKGLPERIEKWLIETLAKIAAWGVHTYETATTWISDTVNSIIDWFKDMYESIKTWLADIIQRITDWGKETYEKATTWVRDTIDSVVTFFSELPGKIWNWLKETISNIIQWGKDLWNEGKQAAIDFVNKVVDEVRELPEKMKQAGRDAIQGLIDGIIEMKDRLVNSVKGLADSFMAGWKSKDGLDIHSPSRRMKYEIGRYIVPGMVEGMEMGSNDLKSSVHNLINGALDKASMVKTNAMRAEPAKGGDVHIHINVQELNGPQDYPKLARIMGLEINKIAERG